MMSPLLDRLYNRLVLSKRPYWNQFRNEHPQLFRSLYHAYRLYKTYRWLQYRRIYSKFRNYTLLSKRGYVANLALCDMFRYVPGAIVECGTWQGGMIAGIATLFNDDRDYYLFDSFEGLPPAQEIDGKDPHGNTAVEWQACQGLPGRGNNLKAEVEFAEKAMELSATKNVYILQGWFNETLPRYEGKPIAILRVDGDWYDSTMDVLTNLYQHVVPGGLMILDDYYYWDGTTKAVHDFLSKNNLSERIQQEPHMGYAYLIKS